MDAILKPPELSRVRESEALYGSEFVVVGTLNLGASVGLRVSAAANSVFVNTTPSPARLTPRASSRASAQSPTKFVSPSPAPSPAPKSE